MDFTEISITANCWGMFGSAARRGDIYLFLPVIIDLTPDNLDINSARGEYLRECPPAAHQLCMNYALCHMFYGLNRYFQQVKKLSFYLSRSL